MTTKEFKKVARILKEAYKEIEMNALNSGVNPLSEQYDELISRARVAVLNKLGYTIEEYREAKAKVAGFSQADLVDELEQREEKLKELDERHIPTEKEIEKIAENVAEKIAQKYITPPIVKHEIVKEVIVEKPRIIETTRVVNEKYNDKNVKEEIKKLEDKISNIKFPEMVDSEKIKKELFSALKKDIQKDIEILGMPDFRKLGMGLQNQIDELKNGGASTFTDLTDTPNSYTGEGGKGVRVKADVSGLEFYTIAGDTDEKVKYNAGDPTAGYVADKIVAGTGISVAEGTGADENKLVVTSSITQYTDEMAQDAVGNAVGNGLDYDDATGTISVDETELSLPFLKLDQTTPQTIENGMPLYENMGNASLAEIHTAMQEPTGFPNRTDSTWSFSGNTLTISPTVTSYDIWFDGVKHTISTEKTLSIADTEGIHLIYFDTDDTLKEYVNPTQANMLSYIRDKVAVASIYWDATNNVGVLVDEERHGTVMDGLTHYYLHNTRGLQWVSGLGLTDFVIGDGSLDSHAQFGVETGMIADEDIGLTVDTIASTTGLPILYKDGANANWRIATQAGYSVLSSGSATNRLYYNQYTSGAWQLTEVEEGDFVLCHIFTTTGKTQQMYAIMGEVEYTTLPTARAGAQTEISALVLGNLPIPEIRPIATVIFQTDKDYENTVKARIVEIEGIGTDDYVDWRTSELPRGVTPTDHGNLTGLTDLDHPASAIINTPSGDIEATTVQGAINELDSEKAPATHASQHDVGATDTIFPADPGEDKFLMWDDDPGTLVWATPSAGSVEGTDVLSTGELGGTKFLREDGDGTCSWQTVTGGTDEKVKYDVDDPSAGYIADKIIAGDGILAEEGTGADENKLVITNTDKGSDVDLSGLVPYIGATQDVNLGSTYGFFGAFLEPTEGDEDTGGFDISIKGGKGGPLNTETGTNGGNLNLYGGKGVGTGTNGQVVVLDPTTSVGAIFDVTGITGTSKTFTFPDETGTLALTSDIPDVSDFITASDVPTNEEDPVVGAVNGIVKSDGNGVISAASAGTDYQAPLTFGISNTNAVKIDAADVADNDFAKFTANGIEGRSYSETLGDIGAAPTASPTFSGTVTLADNCRIDLTLPTADTYCTGPTTDSFASGYTASAGDLVFFGSGGKWLEVDADAVATCKGLIGIALEAKNDTQAMKVALPGSMIRFDAWNWTVGATLYAGETLGAMQEAVPTGADAIIKVVGFALNADTIFFNPSPDQQSVVA